MKNKDVADILTRMGTLLEIKGELVFKVHAYYKAADNISALSEDIEGVDHQGRLGEIPGIGETLEEKIHEYLVTGRMSAYEKLTHEVPETLLDIVEIPSVGPKTAKLLFDELNIKDIPGLKKAAANGTLLRLQGIQERTVAKILQGIQVLEAGRTRMNLGLATRVADEVVARLKKMREVKQIEVAGSLRRGCETVHDIDILIDSNHPRNVMAAFVEMPGVKEINAHGDTKSSVLTKDNVQVDLRVIDSRQFGAALLYFTGSKNFNVRLRQIAMKKEMKVNEYGIFSVKSGKERLLASRTEKECFKALGLPLVPPELREDLGEARIFSGEPFPELIEEKDILGDLHVHSTWSDGRNSIKEMAQAAQARGYEYLAVSDHSGKLKVARGVSPEDLVKKKKEIDDLNKKMKNFRILFGAEVEIDTDGNLDYNERILSQFDIVIGAIHSGFEQDAKKMTKRLVTACQNKYVNILAHPTGVHLGKREPYAFDFKEVCRAARENNVFLEINAFPVRLDLNSSNTYFAKHEGATFTINTDSHSTEHLEYLKFGISVARRGWLTKGDVLNALPAERLLKVIKK